MLKAFRIAISIFWTKKARTLMAPVKARRDVNCYIVCVNDTFINSYFIFSWSVFHNWIYQIRFYLFRFQKLTHVFLMWFENLCGLSTLCFPVSFISISRYQRSFMMTIIGLKYYLLAYNIKMTLRWTNKLRLKDCLLIF